MSVTEQFINDAIEKGTREGLPALSQLEAFVFLISEAEVYCDMDGIDTFIDRYSIDEVLLGSEAFKSIGAMEIAEGLNRISIRLPDLDEAQLSQVNKLITDRIGYDYDAIECMVASRLS